MNGENSPRATRPREGLLRALASYHWAEYLIAILGGNIVYLFIEPGLPAILQHRLNRVDFGLGIDFLICAATYGLVRQVRGLREDRG